MSVSLCLASLAFALGLWWLFVAGSRRFPYSPSAPLETKYRPAGTQETVCIRAADADLEGWLLLPRPASQRPPIIVMAPGLTGTKQGPLESFAEKFLGAGFAVLLIDFRTFGGSGGTPRHWVDPLRQIEDYQSTVLFIREQLSERVDLKRIVLWGSSFSAAAAIGAAARGDSPAAVIAQVPYLGGLPVNPPGRLQIAGYVILSIGESLGAFLARVVGLQRPAAYIATYGCTGETAFAISRDNPSRYVTSRPQHPFWAALSAAPRGGWQNLMRVRGLQNLSKIAPLEDLGSLDCPVLLIGATRDDMISAQDIRAAAERLRHPMARLLQLDAGHYDPYIAPLFDSNVLAQIQFLQEVLASEGSEDRSAAALSH